MTETKELPTCKYIINNGYTHTACGQVEFADVTKHYTYCPDCGRKIDLEAPKEE